MSIPVLVTFIAYFVVLLGIGIYFYRRSVNIEDFLLGGRGMGSWVTALSAQASDMSGWLLMGLPGAIYLGGIGNIWIAIGLFIGTILNWCLISARLRIYTQKTNSITLPCFFEQRFGDPTGLLRIISALIILFFFTIYASAQLVAAGKLFESTFCVPYESAVLIGAGVIIAYTFLGGFLAVCWTDLFQGALMVLALVIVPVFAYSKIGGFSSIGDAMTGIQKSLIPAEGKFSFLAIISMMAWGMGYFGQPHILVRFMSAKSLGKLRQSMFIAIVWVFFALAGAIIIGIVGIGMFADLNVAKGDHEKVFIYMITDVMHPWLAGVMLAAILSAIMSTVDSQLLVSSSALTEDFYQKVIKKNASQKEIILVGRICVIIISVLALILALKPNDTILGIVAYAWGGLGAAFGPLILFALFSRRTTWQSALAGMVIGTIVLVLWRQVGLGDYMYEIVPGFLSNCLTIFLINSNLSQENKRVLKQFDEVVVTTKKHK